MDTIIKNYAFEKFDELNWCYEKDIMYQRDMSTSVPYDEDYYKKYLRYENTDISKKLNNGRANITQKYCCSLLDIGVGSGEFIKNSKIKVCGYDINPIAIEWLKLENIFLDPYKEKIDVDGLSFWDSLEHIKDPNSLLSRLGKDKFVFISMPIFVDLHEIKSSKHYRPNEHFYYFTVRGMINYMSDSGFSIIEIDDFETKAGREDIQTFVFKKN